MEQPNDYALVIGVNQYPNYKSLKGSLKDAIDFANWLTDQTTGGGLEPVNCKRLDNPREVGEVYDALLEITKLVKKAGKNRRSPRRFYLYFSGHGQAPNFEEINLCLSKWDSATGSKLALSASDCWKDIIKCCGFDEVVVFLDCCQVNVFGAGGIGPQLNCLVPKRAPSRQPRIFKAYSCAFLEKSYEGERGGFFTRVLLDALKGGAAQPPGGVRQENLKDYLEAKVPRLVKLEKNVIQEPIVQTGLRKGAVIGNAIARLSGKCTIRFKAPRHGPIVLILPNGTEEVCPDWNRDWELQLDKGLHLLVDRGSSPEYKKDFVFEPKPEMIYEDF